MPCRINHKPTKQELKADLESTLKLARELEDKGMMAQASRGFARADAIEAKLEQMEKGIN